MGIYEVEIALGLNQAMELYVAEYERRYKVRPVFTNAQADQTVIKDLIRAVGLDKTCEAIKTYLKMNEPWFLTKAHSLKVLQDNFNIVHAKSAKSVPKDGRGARIMIHGHRVYCDKCKKPTDIDWEGYMDEFDNPKYCKECV